jgi:hypothetical protein
MRQRKFIGFGLVHASLVLLGWVTYDASQVVATLHLDGVVSEALVALAAMALALAGGAVGASLLGARRPYARTRTAK